MMREANPSIRKCEIASLLEVNAGRITEWLRRGESLTAMRSRRPPGRPRRIPTERVDELADIVHAGRESFGLGAGRWTNAQLAIVIADEMGIVFDRSQIGRLLLRHGLSKDSYKYRRKACRAEVFERVKARRREHIRTSRTGRIGRR